MPSTRVTGSGTRGVAMLAMALGAPAGPGRHRPPPPARAGRPAARRGRALHRPEAPATRRPPGARAVAPHRPAHP
jgi:hypothetical protein